MKKQFCHAVIGTFLLLGLSSCDDKKPSTSPSVGVTSATVAPNSPQINLVLPTRAPIESVPPTSSPVTSQPNPTPAPILNPLPAGASSTSSSSSSSGGTMIGGGSYYDSKGNKYVASYKQVSSKNQDAFLTKYDTKGRKVFEKRLTTSPPDERCNSLVVNKESNIDYLYLLCSVDGGNTDFTKFMSRNAFQKSYGSGGGPKIGVILKLDTSGNKVGGTFLGGKLRSGKTNTINLQSIIAYSDRVVVRGTTAFGSPLTTKPITNASQASSVCKNSGSSYVAELSLDLSTLRLAECK